jgi:hypothetical protein
MKSVRNILFSALLTIGAFAAVTYTACNKDKCKDVVCQNGGTCNDGNCICTFAYTGSKCETAIRDSYQNTYKGSGSDNQGGTYTNWKAKFTNLGTDATAMTMALSDETATTTLEFTIKLTSASAFTVNDVSIGGLAYTGSGTISTSAVSLTLNEKDGSTTTIYTFANMTKQ